MSERDPFKEKFDELVLQAFSASTEGLLQKTNDIIGRMKERVLQEAKTAYRERRGPQLFAYVQRIRERDYSSELVRELGGVSEVQEPLQEPSTKQKLRTPKLKVFVPEEPKSHVGNPRASSEAQQEKLLEILGRYEEEGRLAIPSELGTKLSVSKTTVYDYLNPLLESGKVERVGEKGSKGVRYRLSQTELELGYKPNVTFKNVWSKFRHIGEEGGVVTPIEVLQAIINEEEKKGKVPKSTDLDAIKGKYTATVRLVLGQLVASGKTIQKLNGGWKLVPYTLTKEDIGYIDKQTIEVALEREGEIGRWKAEDVWPGYPERVKQLYEMQINGKTYREATKIGMKLIRHGDTLEPVYFLEGGKGDFKTQEASLQAYRIIAGHVVSSPEEERQIREVQRDVTGKS